MNQRAAGVRALLASLLLLGPALLSTASPARADDAPVAEPPIPHVSDWIGEDGGLQVGADGFARVLFQPEFRDAPSLKARLEAHGLDGLLVKAMPPFVSLPPPKPGAAPPPPVPSRLLLMSKDAKLVTRAARIVRKLDVAPRSAFISILASEVQRRTGFQSGGSLLYDRSSGTDPSNTVFRGFSTSFEPDSYLRSNLTGITPFQGTSLGFGDLDAGGGLFEYSLRMLSRVGCSQFIAWPNLVVHESGPAVMESVRLIPQVLLGTGPTANQSVVYDKREVGLKLRLTPVQLGKETAVLDLDVWLRIPEEVNDASTLLGTMKLKLRQVRTRVTLRDREPLILGGLVLRQRGRSRRGMPRPKELEVLDPLHSALRRDEFDTEICFLIRMRSVQPGKTPMEMKPAVYRGWARGETRTDPFGR